MKKYSRTTPYLSQVKERILLNKKSSTKKTYHIVLDFPESYTVGDSVAILPSNHEEEVEAILHKMQCSGSEIITDPRRNDTLSIREFLTKRANLARVKGSPLTVRDVITPMPPQDLISNLSPLLPRFYSITNSSLVFPNELHLLVAYVEYHLNGQTRYGVGSRFLCDFATEVPLYIQPSNHFTLPDTMASIILIGPGTGVAPYRAFLQERMATNAHGRNWLFFGERNRSTDFYYEDFWTDLERQGHLRLSTAFSRDQAEKVYVQHQMIKNKKELWKWISEGAYLYVCGDANEMAKEVDAALLTIVKEEGSLPEAEALAFLKKMRLEKRYLLDVY